MSRGGVGTTWSSAVCCQGKISERKVEGEAWGQQSPSHLDGYIKAEICRRQDALSIVQ